MIKLVLLSLCSAFLFHAQAYAENKLNILALIPLTGPNASSGHSIKRGIELA
ncbi:branched-chain amino acid ABC transporter substrate-binding protein, partial [bacterium]|nr:branched-chain amino acid ABC transporter substrate-binding protein [bacterium]